MTPPTRAARVAAIEGRLAAATPGLWEYFPKEKYGEHHVSVPNWGPKAAKLGLFPNGCPTDRPEADAQLIAHAPADLAFLLAALAAEREARGRLEEDLVSALALRLDLGEPNVAIDIVRSHFACAITPDQTEAP